MIYINKADLITYIQELLLNSSITGEDRQPDETILDKVEKETIDLVKGYLSGRYQVNKIFDETPVLRNGILVQIICKIVIYHVVRRNAARKVPEDFDTFYSSAIALLERVQTGAPALDNLPVVTGESGASLVYGNNTNPDFFI